MFAPIIKNAQTARGTLITIVDGQRSSSTRDSLVVIDERVTDRTGIRRIEMRHIDIATTVPMRREVVRQLGKTAELRKSHVRAMSVGAGIGGAHHTSELAAPETIDGLRLDRTVRTSPKVDLRMAAVGRRAARHDVHHAAHGVRTVEHGSRAAHHLNPFGKERLCSVGNRMTEKSHILRMAVDKDEHSGRGHARLCRSADAAQRHLARCAVRDAETEQATARGEEAGDLLIQERKKRSLVRRFDLGTSDSSDSHREMAHIGSSTGPRDNDLAHINGTGRRRGVAPRISPADNGRKAHQEKDKFCFSVHFVEYVGSSRRAQLCRMCTTARCDGTKVRRNRPLRVTFFTFFATYLTVCRPFHENDDLFGTNTGSTRN